MSEQTTAIIRGTAILVVLVGAVLWVVYYSMKRSREPGRIGMKWIVSLPIFALIAVSILWLGPLGPFVIVFCAIVLSFIWTPHIGAALASPLTNLFDGGDVESDPQPFYSIARARQKQGRYAEAVALIREQLAKFPKDLEGHMLLAQIQAENLKDLEAAELTIQKLLAQPGHAGKSICFALYSLADWHLKIGQDRETARRALVKVQELLPDSEFSLSAAQRIAHLSGPETLEDRNKIFAVPKTQTHLGVRHGAIRFKVEEETPEATAGKYVKHLEEHPLDSEARKDLARLYAESFGRLDLAAEQLEFLIRQPHQPSKLIIRWLNIMADLQIRTGATQEVIQITLQRIIDLAPGSAAAEQAKSRLAILRLELKGKEKSQAVKLGSYEQNIGLKGRLPNQF